MQLTLLVPELIWPEPDDHDALDALACPALNTLLARSRLTRRPPQSLEATLIDTFGLPEGAPYGALRLLGEDDENGVAGGLAGDTGWMCADPVHLRFQQNQLILADSGSFTLELDEAQAIAGALNAHFSGLGRFHVAAADRWYLQLAATSGLEHPEQLDVPPLSAVAGRRVEQQLPSSPQTANLRRLLNEAQMVLHGHPVNAARERAGRLPINSLWLWGAGTLPPTLASRFDGVCSSQPLALGLGRAAGIPTQAVPPDAATLLAVSARESHPLVVLDALLGPVQYQDDDAYRAALLSLETNWFAPLRQALTSGRITRLHLEASTAYGALRWASGRADQWKLWRRAQPLTDLALALAKGSA